MAGRVAQQDRVVTSGSFGYAFAPARKNGLAGRRAAVVVYSYYSRDPRPKREAEALLREGMEVDVVCLRREPNLPFQERVDGVNVFRVPLLRRRERKWKYVTQYASFLFAALAIVSVRHLKRRYDLVHVHNMPDFLVFSALLPRLSGAKVLLDLHDPMPEVFRGIYNSGSKDWAVRWLKQVEKLSIAFADRVLTPNLAFARLFASRSCPPDKIEIIMNSPEGEVFDPRQYPPAREPAADRPFELIYHGLMAERQGVDLAARAVGKLRERIPNLKLRLYGEPTPYIEEVMRLAKELGLEAAVCYYGYKPLIEIPAAISSADLGLVPNRLSPFTAINLPTRIFEYLALNRAAIVPRTAGILDYFNEDELIFFEPGNIDDFASKIQWAYSHPEQVQAILERGRQVYHRHRWRLEERKFIRLASDLLGSE